MKKKFLNKRFFALLAAFVMAMALFAVFVSADNYEPFDAGIAEPQFMPMMRLGDVNGDGRVDMQDWKLLSMYLNGMITPAEIESR